MSEPRVVHSSRVQLDTFVGFGVPAVRVGEQMALEAISSAGSMPALAPIWRSGAEPR
jgi:hypothetical protein